MKDPQDVVQQIRQHTRQLVRELDIVKGVYLNSGYTFLQCHVLFELLTHKSLNLMTLASNLLIDKSNTSRTVKRLVELGLIEVKPSSTDKRQKLFNLSAFGKQELREIVSVANTQVQAALDNLSEEEQIQAIRGMKLYADALQNSRQQADYTIRRIKKNDNGKVAELIRTVMVEFDACGPGYSIVDPEVNTMYESYRNDRSCYFVITLNDEIVGCGGIGPLKGGAKQTCELRKMFFLPRIRGLGLGRRLLLLLFREARTRGYSECYLETLQRMSRAIALYHRSGFELLKEPIGKTGHSACDRWYLKQLN